MDNQYKITKYTGDMDVIVQNKKKKYAIITIRKDTIEVKYGFDYDKLEFFGEYILGLDIILFAIDSIAVSTPLFNEL